MTKRYNIKMIRNFSVSIGYTLLLATLYAGSVLFSSPSLSQQIINNQILQPLYDEIADNTRPDPKRQIALLESYGESVNEQPLDFQMRYYNKLSLLYIDLSKYREALAAANKGIELFRSAQMPNDVYCELLFSRGFSYESLDQYDNASADYQLGLEHAIALENHSVISQGYVNLGALAYLTNRYAESLTLLNQALNHAELSGNPEEIGMVYSELSILHSYLRKQEESAEFSEKSLHYFLKTDNRASILNEMNNLAASYQGLGKLERAKQQFSELVDLSQSFGNVQYLYYAYRGIASIFEQEENKEAAYEYLTKIDQILPQLQHSRHVLDYLSIKAELLNSMEKFQEALDVLAVAENKIVELGDDFANYHDIYFDNIRAVAYAGLNNFREAINNKKKFIAIYRDYHSQRLQQNTEELRVKLLTEKIESQNVLMEKESALKKVQLVNAESKSQLRQMQITFASLLILLVCYLIVIQIKAQARLKYLSHTDELTGLENRERLYQLANKILKTAIKKKNPLSVFILDIDHFKSINDKFGHHVGDVVIKQVAKLTKAVLRKTDVFARVGGEEFVAILYHSSIKESKEITERIRHQIANTSMTCDGHCIHTTVSIGLTELPLNGTQDKFSFEDLLKNADTALYQAKNGGRNKVVTC